MEIINGTPWAPSPSRYNSDFVLPSTTSTPKQTEDKDITTQQQTQQLRINTLWRKEPQHQTRRKSRQSRSVWRHHTRPTNKRREGEHHSHRFQMGPSKQRRRGYCGPRTVGIWYDEVIRMQMTFMHQNHSLQSSRFPVHCVSKILEHQGRRHRHSIHKRPIQTTIRPLHHQRASTGSRKRWCMVSGHRQKLGKTI